MRKTAMLKQRSAKKHRIKTSCVDLSTLSYILQNHNLSLITTAFTTQRQRYKKIEKAAAKINLLIIISGIVTFQFL
jgi:uncharacterized membrane protein YozB (DUF420 family)